jgi:formate hydrogenlyase transcriptional activator
MLTLPVSETGSDRSTAGRYESLIRIAASVGAHRKPQERFGILVHELGQVLQFDAIAQFDERSNRVDLHMCSGCRKPDSVSSEIDNEEPLAAWVYRHQEAVVLPTMNEDTRFSTSTGLREAGLQSVCAFPLTTAHRRLGSLVIASLRPDAYSPEEVRFCSLVANQIALAMDDAINFQASQRAQERLELLLDLTNRMISTPNLRDVLREISAMQCDGVGIELPSRADKKLRLYALDFPDNPGVIEKGFEPRAEEKAGAFRVLLSGEPVILSKEEIEREPPMAELGTQSLVHVPLIGREGIVGVLSLSSGSEHAFSQDDLAFLAGLSQN